MFGIGPGELFVICVVLIIAVGPERLPQLMKSVGNTVRTLRQASRDIRASVGIDEMMRPDPPPRPKPRKAPAQTLARDAADKPAEPASTPPPPASSSSEASAPDAPPPVAPAAVRAPGETVTAGDVSALLAAAARPAPGAPAAGSGAGPATGAAPTSPASKPAPQPPKAPQAPGSGSDDSGEA